jgi:iron-sulfur cluster assembly accessory protein
MQGLIPAAAEPSMAWRTLICCFKFRENRYHASAAMITLTDKATRALADLLAGKAASPAVGLRLAVRRGGCAGWQYEMKVEEPQSGDVVVETGGARLIVAEDSTGFLQGCVIDYSEDLTDAGFKVINPNAARSCGCGTSFESTSGPAEPQAIEPCGNP